MRDEYAFWSDVILMALTIWREASNQPRAVKVGVACSMQNRVERPSWWGTDILSVLGKKWQYSSLTAPGDPNLVRWPLSTDASWWESVDVAEEALSGELHENPVPGADSYFDESIPPDKRPTWATPDKFVGQLGAFYFYNVDMDHEAETVNAGVGR